MAIVVVEIRPETQAELPRQAAARGVEAGAYAARLLEEAAQSPARTLSLDSDQLESALHDFAQFSRKIPSLADEALSRASLYRDHD